MQLNSLQWLSFLEKCSIHLYSYCLCLNCHFLQAVQLTFKCFCIVLLVFLSLSWSFSLLFLPFLLLVGSYGQQAFCSQRGSKSTYIHSVPTVFFKQSAFLSWNNSVTPTYVFVFKAKINFIVNIGLSYSSHCKWVPFTWHTNLFLVGRSSMFHTNMRMSFTTPKTKALSYMLHACR